MVSITAKVNQAEHERFLQIGRERFGCDNSFQFANLLVQKVLSGELTSIKDNASLQLRAIQQEEQINLLSEELRKAKTTLPELSYKKGYNDAEKNFQKKASAIALKAEFYDNQIATNKGCGFSCILKNQQVKQQINFIQTITDYEQRNSGTYEH